MGSKQNNLRDWKLAQKMRRTGLGCIFKLLWLIGENLVCFSSAAIELQYSKEKKKKKKKQNVTKSTILQSTFHNTAKFLSGSEKNELQISSHAQKSHWKFVTLPIRHLGAFENSSWVAYAQLIKSDSSDILRISLSFFAWNSNIIMLVWYCNGDISLVVPWDYRLSSFDMSRDLWWFWYCHVTSYDITSSLCKRWCPWLKQIQRNLKTFLKGSGHQRHFRMTDLRFHFRTYLCGYFL